MFIDKIGNDTVEIVIGGDRIQLGDINSIKDIIEDINGEVISVTVRTK